MGVIEQLLIIFITTFFALIILINVLLEQKFAKYLKTATFVTKS